ncbi:hypothetical protein PF008_g16572 [Phytophthora fragariae]|uniref:RING-type domain-containing protein n=1 Tax=Phytophthora fragariae TaxID=53985 RepID=A0A6G0RAR8_9STRA|nr:hypothetical protein PF008_g16572 [Phytophthora fragariae]
MPPNGGDAEAAAVRSRPLLHYKDLGLGTQNRKVRFTCVHASENFLVCGANNGSVYLYATSALSRGEGDSRAKYHLVKMISPPSNDRVAVTCLSICPLQKRLVVGTMRGVVYAIQLSDYHKIGEKVEFSHDFHAGFPVTCFLWDKRGTRLFSACNAGLVCQTVLRAGMSAIFGSTDTELLLKEETGIVQLDHAKSERSYILMVSSQLRVLLLNLTSGDGSAVQIGTKARQGAYGACFFTNLNVESIDPAKKREIKVFSSRPGRRVWVADPQSGTVSSTLKFSLSTNPSQFLQSPECAMEEGIKPRNLTINKLGRFQFLQDPPYAPQDVKDATTLLASWNVGSSVLFFLDPFAVEIVEWHLDLGIIHDLKIVNETTLVVLHGEAPKVSLIQSCSADQFLQIYGSDDMKKAVELAIEFNLNDANVVNSLQTQWLAYLGKIGAKSGEHEELTAALKALADKTKKLEEEYRVAVETGLPTPTDSQPLQIIFKQRPQQAIAVASAASSDLFNSQGDSTDTEVTLATGSTLHKPIEYFDVLAPSDQSYSKSICAPDGSFMEARLMDIPELPRANSVLPDDFREIYMEEIIEEVKRSEQIRTEEGAMNMNLLPALKDGSTAAAKAFSTFIPGSSMLTHLIDGSMITDPFGRSDASGIFSDFPEFDEEELVIDPDPPGSKLHLHPLNPEDHANGKLYRLYESEMGITLTLEPRYQWNDEGEDSETEAATADEAEAFVAKYGVYINPDLAAEVCNLRQFTVALKIVLDEVVSSADTAETYDDIVTWISEKKSDKAFTALKERDSLCLLLHLLDILLKKCPEETIEMCVSKYPVLYPWNVEHALLGVELEWEAIDESAGGVREILKPNTVTQTSKYFRYLVRLLEEKGDEAGRDAQVVSRCLDLCFADSAVVGDLFEEENRPSRVAWVAALVRQPHRFMYDHEKCWKVFAANNAFPALLELAMLSLQDECDSAAHERGLNELSELVMLIPKSEELIVFDTLFARVAVLPQSSDECLSKILSQIHASVSIENRNEHLCSAVIHALLNSVNLTYGMRLLAHFPLLFAATPLETYHTIVETHVLTERQKHEIVQILENVDTNVWASYKEDVSATSSVSFAPQLATILQLETGALYPAMNQDQYDMWRNKCKQYDEETTTHRISKVEETGVDISPRSPRRGKSSRNTASVGAAPIACRSFEYRNSDWGGEVQLHDSTCAACDLPVVIISDNNCNLDVVLLPCGHAFHKQCLEDNSCPELWIS